MRRMPPPRAVLSGGALQPSRQPHEPLELAVVPHAIAGERARGAAQDDVAQALVRLEARRRRKGLAVGPAVGGEGAADEGGCHGARPKRRLTVPSDSPSMLAASETSITTPSTVIGRCFIWDSIANWHSLLHV